MAKSNATTVDEYLNELPEERRAVISAVRDTIVKNLAPGYRETLSYGMLTYSIPLDPYAETYNKQPLAYAALAAQKNHYALYLMAAYQDSDYEKQLRNAFAAAGKKLDMGKSCVRFKKLEDIPLNDIGRIMATVGVDDFIAEYERAKGLA